MEKSTRNILLIVLGVLLLLCCCILFVIGIGAYLFINPAQPVQQQEIVITRVATVVFPAPRATPTLAPSPAGTPRPEAVPTGEASAAAALPILPLDAEGQALQESEIPAADRRALALRFNPDLAEIPIVVNAAPPTYAVGARQRFWIANTDTQEHTQITAELKYVTEHVAMWVQEGVRFNQRDLEASANRFEETTYPTNRAFFGSEWTPGVDNDVRLHILHARGLGANVAGYYSSSDQYSRLINQYSNEREMFYISADSGNARPNSAFYDGTLAHEFQHMIHWANDRNEDSWVNEGMSELASYLNGFDPGGADFAYLARPDTQLTTWADPSAESVTEHYGASYLFTTYFLDRFGEELTKAVVASPKNGINGYNEALEKAGRPERFDDVFADWVVANYLDAPEADPDGRFGYTNIDLYPLELDAAHRRYPASASTEVSQYGADYIELQGSGPLTINFSGATEAALTNAVPQGVYSWWSNRGDLSNATLTRAFDLSSLSAATLTFSAWYDIEEGWDYAYLAVSTDGGNRWQILKGRHTTDHNPIGNAFGPGWTGMSGGGKTPQWVDEQVDLTPYAGQEIQLRFEMVTDDAVNRAGLLIDNIAIPELNYADDGEAGPEGWDAAGWILTDNTAMQRWLVQVIEVATDGITVQRMPIAADGQGQLRISDVGQLSEAILVVSALAPVTTEAGAYSYEITQP